MADRLEKQSRPLCGPLEAESLAKGPEAGGSRLKHLQLQIQGMHCASCVGRVEARLRGVPGVGMVQINLVSGEASILFDPEITSADRLLEAVRECGYSAQILPDPWQALRQAFVHRETFEVAWWKRRFLVALGLLIPVLGISLGAEALASVGWGSLRLSVAAGWLGWSLATILQVYVGGPYVVASLRQLRHRMVTMDSLVALGSSVAYLAGTLDWWWSQWAARGLTVLSAPAGGLARRPTSLLGDGLGMHFAEAGLILTFVTLGYWLEHRAKGRASEALRRLVELSPAQATVLHHGRPEEVPAEMVVPGQTILIRPGEKVPLDAQVVAGSSTVDESWLTGEPMPVVKGPGALVLAGTINGAGSLTARVVRAAGQTALAQVIELVRHAQESKPPVSRLADRVVAWFVPAVFGLAVVVVVAWGLAGHWTMAIRAAVAVLVAACPCALGLATPMAVVAATGRAARHGILIKDAAVLEVAGQVDTIVLDKTGTLTEGKPRVVRLVAEQGVSEEDLLITAGAAAQLSTHPLAQAVVAEAQNRHLSLPQTVQMTELAGQGIRAVVEGRPILLGNRRLLEEAGIRFNGSGGRAGSSVSAALEAQEPEPTCGSALPAAESPPHPSRSQPSVFPLSPHVSQDNTLGGATSLWVAAEGRLLGRIELADPLPQASHEAVQQFQALGLEVHLLSGDRRSVAEAVAAQLGIQHVTAEVLPEQKQQIVQQLRQTGRRVAMVGDGINDAPALMAADLGIAIGAGADVALETAQVVLVRSDLRDVAWLIQLARQTMRIIRQNLAWAFGYNVALLPLAAGVLVPWGGPHVPPAAAAAAMAASDLCVVTNSLRLR